jgi:hypothetical protein
MYNHRVVELMLFGVTVGAFLDWTHTDGTEIAYPVDTNHWRGLLTFLVVYSLPGWLYTKWMLYSNAPYEPAPYPQSVAATFVFCVAYMLTSYGDTVFALSATQTCAVLTALAVYFWAVLDGSWQGVVGATVTAIVGCSVEHLVSEQQLMQYRVREMGLVPFWLFAVYLLSAATWGQVCRRVLTTRDPVLSGKGRLC